MDRRSANGSCLGTVPDEESRLNEPEAVARLVEPIMIAAFEGWNDAGSAASGALDHLESVWESTEIASLDPEDYYDFQVNRPHVVLDDGERSIIWPTTRLSTARLPGHHRDILLVRGIEPNIRWRAYSTELIDYGKRLGVEMVLTLGALLAEAPHTRPVPVSGSVLDHELAERLGLEQSSYEGPTGIVGVFQDACATAGLPAVSFWAAVPHYVASVPCPKATVALLRRIEDMLDISVPLGDLPEETRIWQQGADELAAKDEEIGEYVRQLEESKDTADLPEATGEFIAREFERYLRRQQEHGGSGPADASPQD
jgi:proteasome assembly chaperone (PAC2) family protein